MFRKYRILSAPFAFFATSLILVIVMLMPGDVLPVRGFVAVSSASGAWSVAEAIPLEPALETEAEAETETMSDGQLPARAETVCAYKESAPPSTANSLADQTPEIQEQIRLESAAREDAVSSLPVENYIPYVLNKEEYDLLCWCVEGEAHGKSFEHRCIITQVIFNRVFSDRFPNTVKQVLLSPNQFSPMVWYSASYVDQFVTPLTREAVNAVMNAQVDDLSQGALYFCNPKIAGSVDWFDNCLVTLFEFEEHRFYTDPRDVN